MNNHIDRLEATAGALELYEDGQGPGVGAYYHEYGLVVFPSPIGLETPNVATASWWMPEVFRAQTRKVLRMVFQATVKGGGLFLMTIRTYDEGLYQTTVSADQLCILVIDMTNPLTEYFVVDVECGGHIADNTNIEVDLSRQLYDRGEDPLDADDITVANARFLSPQEADAAYAAGTVRVWLGP
jgi:hypothetical protein